MTPKIFYGLCLIAAVFSISVAITVAPPSYSTSSHIPLVFLLPSTASSSSFNADLTVFAQYLQPGDILFIGGNSNSNPNTVLKQVNLAKSLVVPGVNVYAVQTYTNIADFTYYTPKLPKGFDYVIYDYEKGSNYSTEFTTNEAVAISYFDTAENTVHQYNSLTGGNTKLMVSPSYSELRNYGWDWGLAAQHMDTINPQMQGFIDFTNYYDLVNKVTTQVKTEAPNTQLFIETSIARDTVQNNVNAINTLQPLPIDGILVFFDNGQSTDLTSLFNQLGY